MAIRKRLAAVGAATAIALSGCATNGLGDLPLPAPGVGTGGYHLTALFSNILNLPNNAKVKLAGADVGQVDDMRVSNYTAITTLRILTGFAYPKAAPPSCVPRPRWATSSSRSGPRRVRRQMGRSSRRATPSAWTRRRPPRRWNRC